MLTMSRTASELSRRLENFGNLCFGMPVSDSPDESQRRILAKSLMGTAAILLAFGVSVVSNGFPSWSSFIPHRLIPSHEHHALYVCECR